jgi:hypothetical protein
LKREKQQYRIFLKSFHFPIAFQSVFLATSSFSGSSTASDLASSAGAFALGSDLAFAFEFSSDFGSFFAAASLAPLPSLVLPGVFYIHIILFLFLDRQSERNTK